MKNILFLSVHSPFKSESGAHQRSRHFCSAFSKFAFVDVYTTDQDADCNIDNCSKIEYNIIRTKSIFLQILKIIFLLFIPPVITKLIHLFTMFSIKSIGTKDAVLSKEVRNILKNKKYDYIFVRYLTDLIKFGIAPKKNVILDIDDLPEEKYMNNFKYDSKSFLNKIYFYVCSKTCRFYTKLIVKKVLVAYLPNKNQCELFKNAVYLPNIPYQQDVLDNNIINKSEFQIMFVGLIDYSPNWNGLLYFLKNIYPNIIQNIPDINFNIIGKISENRKEYLLKNFKNISLAGFAADLNHEYQNNLVVVVPIYQGAGTNIKVVEAMSLGKACVITSNSGRGYDKLLIDGKNILIAKNDIDFAEKTIKLLQDNDYRKSIEIFAKKSINEQYSFNFILNTIKYSINI